MQYIIFDKDPNFSIAILSYELDYPGMAKNYVEEGFISQGADASISQELIAYNLPFEVKGKKRQKKAPSVSERREYLLELLGTLDEIGIKHVLVANTDYYKTLTGSAKAAAEVGSLSPPDGTHFADFSHMRVGYIPNYKMVFYDPEKTLHGIRLATKSIVDDRNQTYQRPGSGIIHKYHFPQSIDEISDALLFLLEKEDLSVDIEGFSLEHHDAGIASIAFAWNQHEGIAFQVDLAPGFANWRVRNELRFFFQLRARDRKKHIYHNAAYDVPVLIYQLGQTGGQSQDPVGLMEGLFDALADPDLVEDTKIISYLATNSCAGNQLGLKAQAVEFAGNYAVDDIKDVTKIPVRELLEYNLIDACATWYVYNKNNPKMIADNQESIYRGIFLPGLVDVIDMQLNGLPVNMERVAEAKAALTKINDAAMDIIQQHPVVVEYTHHLKEQEVERRNAAYKKKRITTADVTLTFNPNSDLQLRGLLYGNQFFGLPVLGTTDSGAESTKGAHINSLKSHTEDPTIIEFLDAMIDLKDSAILLNTFIPAMENARLGPDGMYHMHGNFNLGGTVSGRLSSSDPNLQNLPSKSRLAKWIKYCICVAPGWLFVGLDFDSLEDKISALVTKDPNKLKVYTDGFDGHSLRAFSYFGDQMNGIDGSSVESINSIADRYPHLRQLSKTPTFLLTYGGTHHGMIEQCGFEMDTALRIEENYHELYRVSDQVIEAKLEGARQNGYIEVAFGLRVRTPILGQTIETQRHTPYAAKAEGRTAGNAVGQSWGLLNNRAASEVMQKVRADRQLRRKIKICCQIHDAQYYMVRAERNTLLWLNKAISKAVAWQEHPDIQHDQVKLSGKLAIFYPTWSEEYPLSNNADLAELEQVERKIFEDMENV